MKAHQGQGDHRHGRPCRSEKEGANLLDRRSSKGVLLCLALLSAVVLALPRLAIVSASAPAQGAPTRTASIQDVGTPTQAASTPAAGEPTRAADPEPMLEATRTPAAVGPTTPGQPTRAADPEPTLEATGMPALPGGPTPPAPAGDALLEGAHLAVQVSDSVTSVGGTANSKVLVFWRDVQPGIHGYSLRLRFDPHVVQIEDADGDAANGTQIAMPAWSAAAVNGPQRVTENQVDNEAGEIQLTVLQEEGAPVAKTPEWLEVATLTWTGQSEGRSAIVVDGASHFVAPGGQRFRPDVARNGVVSARSPGQLFGAVRLQGRAQYEGVQIASSLAATYIDRARTGADGRFALVASHGEGFYTLTASVPGYLSAESQRPVKVTMGSTIDLGSVTLYGGDVNGDDRIDVRDLAYVAWHIETDDARADINGDGQVDDLDLGLAAGNFGRVGPSVWQIPEAR